MCIKIELLFEYPTHVCSDAHESVIGAVFKHTTRHSTLIVWIKHANAQLSALTAFECE